MTSKLFCSLIFQVKSRHLLQIEVHFTPSLWQMVHLTYLQLTSQIGLGKSRHLLQIEVRFTPSLWHMVAADLPAICSANWVRSSKKHCLSTVLFFYYIVYLFVYRILISYILFVSQGFDWV